ncbi:MAG: toll/interleukin-1 receptor domain-containing protein [Prochloraceae cyanobacterium]|nr:toll/interleukin-1 receptor domain-containing protein [Prochloraceae cyanobacterium]
MFVNFNPIEGLKLTRYPPTTRYAEVVAPRAFWWWAIQQDPDPLDKIFWEKKYGVQAFKVDSLKNYISEVENLLLEQDINPYADVLSVPSSPKVVRDKVFISYSDEDKDWLEKLQRHLNALSTEVNIDIFNDTDIKPGAKRREEIENAIARAKLAILLVSSNFLSSEVIKNHELPDLLEAAEKEGLTIFWIYVSSCSFKYSPIRDYQAAHDISKPLDRLTQGEQEEMLMKICEKLVDVVNT